MAYLWLFVSQLLLLILPKHQNIPFGHALDVELAADIAAEVDVPCVEGTLKGTVEGGIGTVKRSLRRDIVVRKPQDDTVPYPLNTTTTDTSSTSTTSTDGKSDNGDSQYDEPVRDYEPAVDPIDNDADYPNYNEQVMNSDQGGLYQYQIQINADINGDDIDLTDYQDYDVSSMLKCTSLCNTYNSDRNGLAVCQAVAYYGGGECYLLTNVYMDSDGRYTYYSSGGITGLMLRDPTYPQPTESSPLPPDDTYPTTTTTTTSTSMTTTATIPPSTYAPSTPSQSVYSKTTIYPTDVYGKTIVNVYISSCPAATYY